MLELDSLVNVLKTKEILSSSNTKFEGITEITVKHCCVHHPSEEGGWVLCTEQKSRKKKERGKIINSIDVCLCYFSLCK